MTTQDNATGTGVDELNLANFPVAAIHDGAQSPMVFHDQVFDAGNGEVIQSTLQVSAASDVGLPGIADLEVLLGMISLHHQHDHFDRQIFRFTPTALRTLMGWPRQGFYSRKLRESVARWGRVHFQYRRAWYDKVSGRLADVGFHPLNFTREIVTGRGVDTFEIRWDDHLFANLAAGNIRLFDMATFRGIRSPIAKQMFRYFGRQAHTQSLIQKYDVRKLAVDKIGLFRTNVDHMGRVKQNLDKGFAQLENIGFLARSAEDRYRKKADGAWEVTVRVSDGKTPPASSPVVDLARPAISEYLKLGVSRAQVLRIAAERSDEYMMEKIEILRTRRRKTDNKAGFLVKACDENYVKNQVDFEERSITLIPSELSRKVDTTTQGDLESQWRSLSENEQIQIREELEVRFTSELNNCVSDIPAGLKHGDFGRIIKHKKVLELWEMYILRKNESIQ